MIVAHRVVRLKLSFGLVVAGALLVGTVCPLGAASSVQKCNGPTPSKVAGRASFAPGLNRLSVAQHVTITVSLFDCSPRKATRGAGRLKSTITPKGEQTCALVNRPKVFKSTAKLMWKNNRLSTIALTLSLTGKSKVANITGRVISGLFNGHRVTGQYRYKLIVAPIGIYPHGDGVARACANKRRPGYHGRIAISGVDLYTTAKHLTVS